VTSIPDPTECPYYLISRATLVVTAELRRELATAGVGQIRVSYLGALMSLWQQDELKAGDLGRRAGLEPSTMTNLLDRMSRDGLVERRPDPNDRRAQRIILTDEGRRVREPILVAVDRTFSRILSGVPEHDMEQMKQVLRQILINSRKTS